MNATVKKLLEIAAAEVGVREQPLGSNWGPRVSEYIKSVGFSEPIFWCNAFTSWCFAQTEAATGQKIAYPRTASCDVSLAWGRAHECLYTTPEPGDQFLVLASEDDATHTGFVRSVDGDTFGTIEGNSNDNGSSNGIGVFAETRTLSSRYRFIRWAQLLGASDAYTLFLNGKEIGPLPVSGGVSRFPARQWGELMGFTVGWDAEARAVTFDGDPIPEQPLVIDGTAYLPIRVLAQEAGLRLSVDNSTRRVDVERS